MPALEEHPDRRLLADFLLGRLGGSEQEYVEQRLAADPRWLAVAGEVEAYDGLVETVCRAGGSLSPSDPAPIRELIRRLEGLRRFSPPEAADDSSAAPSRAPSPSAIDYSSLRPAEMPDELGRLAGFRVLRLPGAGGMGIVFEAEDPVLRRRVALKVMRPTFAAVPMHRQRFLREARAAAALRHDHIIEIYQVGEDNDVPFLAMPLLTGESLDHCLSRLTALDLLEVVLIGREIAAGLAVAHAGGVIHRDIKPANIWLEALADCPTQEAALRKSQRTIGRVKLLDFGLARVLEEDDGLTMSGAIVGTPGYLAPEQAEGAVADTRSDLFAFGCVLYRMATGQEPFPGTTRIARLAAVVHHEPLPPHLVSPNIPQPLSDLIQRLLAKGPDERPPSAPTELRTLSELVELLSQAAPDLPVVPLATNGELESGIFVCNQSHSLEQLMPLPRIRRAADRWHGVVSCTRSSTTRPENRDVIDEFVFQSWGDHGMRIEPFLFFGDPNLLRRIDQIIRNHSKG